MPNNDALRQFKADIFQALAHPTRIAIAELLRKRELSAGQIIQLLELEQANASQHLAVLRAKRIVIARKEGNQVFYSLRDRALGEILDSLRGYFQRYLRAARADLKEVSRLEARAR
jgi:DNA-binding transcriptional ArsR family regulator